MPLPAGLTLRVEFEPPDIQVGTSTVDNDSTAPLPNDGNVTLVYQATDTSVAWSYAGAPSGTVTVIASVAEGYELVPGPGEVVEDGELRREVPVAFPEDPLDADDIVVPEFVYRAENQTVSFTLDAARPDDDYPSLDRTLETQNGLTTNREPGREEDRICNAPPAEAPGATPTCSGITLVAPDGTTTYQGSIDDDGLVTFDQTIPPASGKFTLWIEDVLHGFGTPDNGVYPNNVQLTIPAPPDPAIPDLATAATKARLQGTILGAAPNPNDPSVPLPDARLVFVTPTPAPTPEYDAGSYLVDLETTSTTFTVEAPGFITSLEQNPTGLALGQVREPPFETELARAASLTVTVPYPGGVRPPGFGVTLTPAPPGGTPTPTVTNGTEIYEFTGLPADTYTLSVTAPGFYRLSKSYDLDPPVDRTDNTLRAIEPRVVNVEVGGAPPDTSVDVALDIGGTLVSRSGTSDGSGDVTVSFTSASEVPGQSLPRNPDGTPVETRATVTVTAPNRRVVRDTEQVVAQQSTNPELTAIIGVYPTVTLSGTIDVPPGTDLSVFRAEAWTTNNPGGADPVDSVALSSTENNGVVRYVAAGLDTTAAGLSLFWRIDFDVVGRGTATTPWLEVTGQNLRSGTVDTGYDVDLEPVNVPLVFTFPGLPEGVTPVPTFTTGASFTVPTFNAAATAARQDGGRVYDVDEDVTGDVRFRWTADGYTTSARQTIDVQVRIALSAARPFASSSLPQVAATLNMSRATLSRKLQREGVAFQTLKDEVRRDRAIALLTGSSATVEAIAEALDFSEPSAFRRAFKAWTGVSPRAYRS